MTLTHTLLALLVTLTWGLNFVVIRFGLDELPPVMFTALRFWLTALPWIFIFKRPPAFTLPLLVYSLGTFVVQFGLLFSAMALGASAGLSSLILQVQIFFTLIFAYLILGERCSRIQLIGIAVSCAGLVLIMANLGGDMPLMPFLLLIAAAAAWGCGNIASKQLGNVPVMSLVVWGGLLAAPFLTIISLVLETEAWQWQTITQLSLTSWLSLFYVVFLSTFLGYGLWGYLLQRNNAGDVVQFALMVPIFGMSSSAIILGEAITWWKVTAAALIIGGLVISRLKR